ELLQQPREPEHACRPAHILLHEQHRRGALQIQAAAVKTHALTHEGHARCPGAMPAAVDEAWRAVAAAAHGRDQWKALLQFRAADHADLRALLRELSRRRFELEGLKLIGGGVDEVA